MLCGKLDHHKLEIYEIAHQFVLHVYKNVCASFPNDEANNLTSQIKRAAVSLPLNIAEATGCMSFRACLNFLSFSFRSCKELEAALRLCRDLGYVNDSQYLDLDTCERLDRLVRKLFKYMEYISAQADKRNGYRQQQVMNNEFVNKRTGMGENKKSQA
jgi:four helix bundle protein